MPKEPSRGAGAGVAIDHKPENITVSDLAADDVVVGEDEGLFGSRYLVLTV